MNRLWLNDGAITVMTDARGRPERIIWHGQAHCVVECVSRWRIVQDWWTQHPVRREYSLVRTDTGLLLTLYHDLEDDTWRLQRLSD